MLVKVYGEDLGLVGGVVGVGADGNFFVGVVVMRGISFRGLCCGLYEVFGGEAEREAADRA